LFKKEGRLAFCDLDLRFRISANNIAHVNEPFQRTNTKLLSREFAPKGKAQYSGPPLSGS
jgi:hypothetical protein